jgi:hypothetical protein
MSKTIYLTKENLHEVHRNTYMIWVYMDLAEKCVTNIDAICRDKDIKRQLVKQKLEAMQKNAVYFRNELNSVHKTDPNTLERFGEMADALEINIKIDLYNALKAELKL